jgi:hypothetical protein
MGLPLLCAFASAAVAVAFLPLSVVPSFQASFPMC